MAGHCTFYKILELTTRTLVARKKAALVVLAATWIRAAIMALLMPSNLMATHQSLLDKSVSTLNCFYGKCCLSVDYKLFTYRLMTAAAAAAAPVKAVVAAVVVTVLYRGAGAVGVAVAMVLVVLGVLELVVVAG